jgi:cyclase
MERVTENVFALTDRRGSNPGYVVTREGVVLIDTAQLPTDAIKMREEIREKGGLRFLINTEFHLDHIFGNLFYVGLCPVITHKYTKESFWAFRPGVDLYDFMVDMVKDEDPRDKLPFTYPEKRSFLSAIRSFASGSPGSSMPILTDGSKPSISSRPSTWTTLSPATDRFVPRTIFSNRVPT